MKHLASRRVCIVAAGHYCVRAGRCDWMLQLKARARITLPPLVETIPCLGSVSISLLESPTVDLALMLINQLDIMAFPGLNLAANLVLKMVGAKSAIPLDFACMACNLLMSLSAVFASSYNLAACYALETQRMLRLTGLCLHNMCCWQPNLEKYVVLDAAN